MNPKKEDLIHNFVSQYFLEDSSEQDIKGRPKGIDVLKKDGLKPEM